MDRVAVKSTAVRELGYDAETETMEVLYHPNRFGFCAVWRYTPVSQEQYDAFFAEGASVGRLLTQIKADLDIASFKVGEEAPEAVGA